MSRTNGHRGRCGRDCYACHGSTARQRKRKLRVEDVAAMAESAAEGPAECLGSCPWCDEDPIDQPRCYEESDG